ncbi:TonB-dependent receptor [Brevundimonas sp.]|uniref:TonB-dependent receptor domain-containing protein n=1 Tax=Brevundimonas sp. TaxID=1871086 RepID=UPI0025C5BF7C|nr:TonB-dependent receptor [Brevundimonas sp.]
MHICTGARRTRAAYRSLLVATCAYGALASGAALAQERPVEAEPEASEVSEIVVTGSRIARPDYVANSPIISVSAQAIEDTGQVTVEKALSQLPQFSGSFGQGNTGSTSTGLNGGQSYASLRGLGAKRTLLLLDGMRLQPSNPDGSVDLNVIPETLIGNVEVITGGASTVYGSDATAGVVNFRLRRNIQGVEVGSTYGISDYGDGESFRFNVISGGSIAEGRGRALLSLDYTNRERATESERDFFLTRSTTNATATTPQGAILFGANTPTLAAVNALFVNKYGTPALTGSAGRFTNQLGFNLDGTLFNQVGTQPVRNFRDPETDEAYISPTGTQINFGSPSTAAVQNDMERYSLFSRIDYDISDTLRFFAQGSMVTLESVGIANPSLASGTYALTAPSTNPFLARTDMVSVLASRTNPTADFTFQKAFDLAGARYQPYSYDLYQFTVGLSGDVPYKDWTWEAYASASQAKFVNEQTGGVSYRALRNLLYSPTGGTEFCAGGFNPFGNFIPSQDCIDYMSIRTLNSNTLKQRSAEATIQGGLFALPAGEVRYAAGVSYRYNAFAFDADRAFQEAVNGQFTSDVLGYSVLRSNGGSVDTTEVYGELLVPVLANLPFIKEFNLDLGYRFSDYNTVGGVSAYKADFEWRVIDPVRLRGGYNRSVRAPSPGELFAPQSTASVGTGTASPTTENGDPCDTRSFFRQASNPNAAQVRALCLAQGVPASLIDTFTWGSAQAFALTGGNEDLYEETTDTYSFGVVVQSPFEAPLLSGMSVALDWYNIKIKDAIGALSVTNSIRYCFNSGGNNPTYDPNNYYCSLLARNADTGLLLNPVQPLLNLGQFNVEGVDLVFDWRLSPADIGIPVEGTLSLNSAISYLGAFEIQDLPGAPTYDYAGAWGTAIESNAGLAHPEWKINTSITYSRGWASVGLRWRFIDEMIHSSLITNPASTTPNVDAYNVFDMNARFDLSHDTSLRLNVTNLLNEEPPQAGTTPGSYDSQNYDTVGRYFTIAVTKKF